MNYIDLISIIFIFVPIIAAMASLGISFKRCKSGKAHYCPSKRYRHVDRTCHYARKC